MNENEELIHRFYTAFQQLDSKTMATCYHEKARFKDPVFHLHTKKEIAGMWQMLCAGATEFDLSFSQVKAEEQVGSVHWEARYLFSKTKRPVINKIEAHFRFSEGKIIDHIDTFNFWKWSSQALGIPGYMLGWSSFLKSKVQNQAKEQLNAFLLAESKL